MALRKKVKIKYVAGWLEESGYKIPKFGYKEISGVHTKRYHNCLYLLAGLNASCRDLMDFLCEVMDKDNKIYSNEKVRQDFIGFISGLTRQEVVYTHNTVKKAYRILSEKSLLIPLTRGVFMVNPEFFFKKGDKERIEAIELILNFEKSSEVDLTTAKDALLTNGSNADNKE
jgi:hypothetical protein